jgi:hypothetical protein
MLHVSAKVEIVASRAKIVAKTVAKTVGIEGSLIIVHVGTINRTSSPKNSTHLRLQKTEFGQQRDFFI